jgi:hypothetical protein
MTDKEVEKIRLVVENRKGLLKAITHFTSTIEHNFISEIYKEMTNHKANKYESGFMTTNGETIKITVEIQKPLSD